MSFEFHGNREMCDERSLLEIEMHDKIKRVAEILDVLEGLEGGGGSGFILERDGDFG